MSTELSENETAMDSMSNFHLNFCHFPLPPVLNGIPKLAARHAHLLV
jgi:hypothetical protein